MENVIQSDLSSERKIQKCNNIRNVPFETRDLVIIINVVKKMLNPNLFESY